MTGETMSDQGYDASAYPASPASVPATPDAPPRVEERIARGLLSASLAVVAGAVLTVLIWRLGYIASITSFAMAAGAVWLYALGAGATPRKGLVPLLVLIVVGVVVAFFAVIASDASDVYTRIVVAGSESRMSFVLNNIFRGDVLREYTTDMAMFGGFAVLGVFGTMRRLLSSSH